ncbi:hypothetical protein AGMMS50222_08270 [Endomicrobiia bacterium]|nr:hypothetical protein AGMMS49531_08240 [Endomicrobiia bacterium]GHT66631.1 hypothetical protein AGMMS49556_07760 [Endomicrobiia bacterium]GHT72508.1 hypothetical protein AGMMS49950_11000 [Endomicrobiia bacterium]GHT76131.1 hypothetical protein AGMMS50222_08270 [Endomicrobiia bacterium]
MTLDEVKTAYRRMAQQHHPDKNLGSPESTEKMKKINEAKDILDRYFEQRNKKRH